MAQILAALRLVIPDSSVGLMLQSCCGFPLRGAVAPEPAVADDSDFTLELRLAAWLASVKSPCVLVVPEYLKPWLPFPRAVAIPCYTPAWHAGTFLADARVVDKPQLRRLTEIAAEVALNLEEADRRHCRRVLREVADPSNVRRIPTSWLTRRTAQSRAPVKARLRFEGG